MAAHRRLLVSARRHPHRCVLADRETAAGDLDSRSGRRALSRPGLSEKTSICSKVLLSCVPFRVPKPLNDLWTVSSSPRRRSSSWVTLARVHRPFLRDWSDRPADDSPSNRYPRPAAGQPFVPVRAGAKFDLTSARSTPRRMKVARHSKVELLRVSPPQAAMASSVATSSRSASACEYSAALCGIVASGLTDTRNNVLLLFQSQIRVKGVLSVSRPCPL
jgi:hypothetical protein